MATDELVDWKRKQKKKKSRDQNALFMIMSAGVTPYHFFYACYYVTCKHLQSCEEKQIFFFPDLMIRYRIVVNIVSSADCKLWFGVLEGTINVF